MKFNEFVEAVRNLYMGLIRGGVLEKSGEVALKESNGSTNLYCWKLVAVTNSEVKIVKGSAHFSETVRLFYYFVLVDTGQVLYTVCEKYPNVEPGVWTASSMDGIECPRFATVVDAMSYVETKYQAGKCEEQNGTENIERT